MEIVFQLSVRGFCTFICLDTELFFSISKHFLCVKEICLRSVICARDISPHFNFVCVFCLSPVCCLFVCFFLNTVFNLFFMASGLHILLRKQLPVVMVSFPGSAKCPSVPFV